MQPLVRVEIDFPVTLHIINDRVADGFRNTKEQAAGDEVDENTVHQPMTEKDIRPHFRTGFVALELGDEIILQGIISECVTRQQEEKLFH